MSLKLPADFAKKISESLGMTPLGVDTLFTIEEDKQGFFVAKLKPGQFLEREQFKTMCALARDLGGEGYLQGAKAWAVPGPFAKKSPEKPSEQRQPGYKEPGNVLPAESKKETTPGIAFSFLPVEALLSMPFQCRSNPDDPDLLDLAESLKAYGVLEPIVVRQKPNGLFEIAMGGRRVKAAKKAGLIEVPAIIRPLSDEEASVCQLIENIHRRDLSDVEKSKALAALAKTRGWSAEQLAQKLAMSYTWVTKYLPDEFKAEEKAQAGKAGGEAKAEAYRESQDFATRRVAETQEIPPIDKIVLCARCGDPIEPPAIHSKGKFYCTDCAEILKTEQAEPEGVPEPEPVESEKEPVATPPRVPPVFDVGEFMCLKCNERFRVEHLPNGKHRLQPIREAVKA